MALQIRGADGTKREVPVLHRIYTETELEYFCNGGILHYVLRNIAKAA
jgi:aconitate hydratase